MRPFHEELMKALRWLLVWLVGLVASPQVLASTVAVVDFDGYGVSFDDSALVSQGLRDAFLETSWLPLSDFDIADRLSAGHEADISSARRLVSDARQALDRGQASTALSKLRQADKLHRAAGSEFGRRPELADVQFFLGRAYLNLGRRSDAKKALVECLTLFPGYPDHRAPSMGSSLRSLFDEAQRAIDGSAKRVLSSAEAANLQNRLGVDAVVVGYLESDGTVFARITRGTTITSEVRRQATSVPPFPGEPIYGQLVRELVGEGGAMVAPPDYGGGSAPYATDSYDADPYGGGSGSGGSSDFDDIPAFDDDLPAFDDEPAQDEPGMTVRSPKTDPPPPEHAERESGFRTSTEKDARIRSTGRMKYDSGPITHQPWFWGVVAGGVVVGGGVAAIVVLSDGGGGDTSDDPEGGDATSYTLTLATGD